ncbi:MULTISPECIES: hypothetical protein [Pseudomonas fluorescens group]|uniref:Uncharacterized protein n=1 Tax=Pseudomonas fluorescens TaxID=294 RepID=A0A0D0TS35_PSEFL|nr:MULTISPECIES: hypothetical protein [Pseudomonas fluorescens group]AZE62668.1 ABC transporter, transmembrane region:ABC transporter:Peptidase C39, bacteriocin processing [Pseudomonas synxantha]KIR23590.1 hypothetical protein PFLU3_09410 [Pseudomonas fluorescens]
MISRTDSTADEFLRVLHLTGPDHVAAKHGTNLPISESGEGLSDGLRQLVSLARIFLHGQSYYCSMSRQRHGHVNRSAVSRTSQMHH